jgi:sec-independent protein translocase protein TatA
MVGDIFQPTHLLFVLVVALLVLGPKRLPEVGRTLGAGIRDFRQALSGDSSDSSQRHDSEQVATSTDLHQEPETSADHEVVWPEEAVGPTSYDEPVEAATAEPAATVVTDADPATEIHTEPPASVGAGPAPTSTTSTHRTDDPAVPDLDSLYFHTPADEATPVADSGDSAESHADQIS